MNRRGHIALIGLALLIVAGCTRDEETAKRDSVIKEVLLPTVAPDAVARPPAERSPTSAVVAAAPTATVTPIRAPLTEAPAAAPTAKPPGSVEPRDGVVERGVDLRAGPSMDARIRGTFQGRTDVEVLREEGEFALVRAPVVNGGFVEGWVLAASVRPPGTPSSPATKPAPARPQPVSPGSKPAAPAAPVKAHSASDKGPNDILLQPIAGTEKKRPGTPFTHKAHWDQYSIECVACHHKVKALGNIEPKQKTCTEAGCHTANQCDNKVVPKKNSSCPNFEDAYHMNCITCHKQDGGPTKCAECHTG